MIADVLKTNTTLRSLDISHNQLGHDGVRWISEALKENSTLQSLDMYSLTLGLRDITLLIEALRENTSLVDLVLYDKTLPISKDLREAWTASEEIEKYLNRNKSYLYDTKPACHIP